MRKVVQFVRDFLVLGAFYGNVWGHNALQELFGRPEEMTEHRDPLEHKLQEIVRFLICRQRLRLTLLHEQRARTRGMDCQGSSWRQFPHTHGAATELSGSWPFLAHHPLTIHVFSRQIGAGR